MDILGTIGGFYEILYITTSLFLKRIIDYFFNKNLIKKVKGDGKEWFSYPSVIVKRGKKSSKVQQEDMEESKNWINEDRKQIYKGENI